MKICKILDELKKEYSENCIVRENGTLLLEPGKIPKCRHMLFRELDKKTIEDYLVSQYENKFPSEYIEFLKYSNGANLCSVKLNTPKFSFAEVLLVVFGLPFTPPFGRPLDMEEPFDLRVEDFGRHKEIPKTWLKCGTFIKDYNFRVTNDIFIDTKSNQVFACEKNQKDIIDRWNSLDDCLCSIYQSFNDMQIEYKIDL